MGVYGDLACVSRLVFRGMGIPHVVVWETLLGGAFRVIVGVDGGNCVEPWFLD